MGWRENFQKVGGHPCFKDETGKRYGVVVVETRGRNDGGGNARWHCRCDVCGGTHLLIATGFRARPPTVCPARKRTVAIGRDSRVGHPTITTAKETDEWQA